MYLKRIENPRIENIGFRLTRNRLIEITNYTIFACKHCIILSCKDKVQYNGKYNILYGTKVISPAIALPKIETRLKLSFLSYQIKSALAVQHSLRIRTKTGLVK